MHIYLNKSPVATRYSTYVSLSKSDIGYHTLPHCHVTKLLVTTLYK